MDEVQEEVAEFRGGHDAVPSRRVVLVPQSTGDPIIIW